MKNFTVLLCLCVAFMFTGCQQQNTENATNNNNLVKVSDTAGKKEGEKTNQEVAQHLVKLTSSIPNVNDATAVVVGDYAVVGIDVDKRLDRSRVGTIKYTVAESLKKDPYGANAVVVADPDMFTRLDKMAEDVANGQPAEGIMNELAAIIGRVMPEVPSDGHEEKGPTEVNEKELQKEDQKQLDHIQNDQANHKMK